MSSEPMRLADLDARFIGNGGEGVTDKDGNPVPYRPGVAVVFDCPKCGADHPGCIEFTNPLDGGPPARTDGHTWQREGDTIDTLTLRPSILRKDCGWHGFITNGEITEA